MFGYGGYGDGDGAMENLGEAAMENMEATMLDGVLGRGNPVSGMLRMEAAVNEVEAVIEAVKGDFF